MLSNKRYQSPPLPLSLLPASTGTLLPPEAAAAAAPPPGTFEAGTQSRGGVGLERDSGRTTVKMAAAAAAPRGDEAAEGEQADSGNLAGGQLGPSLLRRASEASRSLLWARPGCHSTLSLPSPLVGQSPSGALA